MADGLFLIGSDRDVGKTMVGTGLVGLLRSRGMDAVLMTPTSTGGSVESAGRLLEFVGGPGADRKLLNPYEFETLASPYVSSQVEERPIEPSVILDAFRRLTAQGKFVVVEGGGPMVPLRSDYFVLDLVVAFQTPSLVISRSSRGTLNLSLLTLRALASRGIKPLGVVLNGFGRFGEGFAESLNPDTLEELEPAVPVVATLEWRPEFDDDFTLFLKELSRQERLMRLIDELTAKRSEP